MTKGYPARLTCRKATNLIIAVNVLSDWSSPLIRSQAELAYPAICCNRNPNAKCS